MSFSFSRFSRLNLEFQFLSLRGFKANALLVPLLTLLMMTVASQVNAFEPPPKSGAPKGTSGGGTRPAAPSRCLQRDANALQTLTPPSGVGYTAQQRPQFWVYLPPHQTVELEFTLQALEPHPTTGQLESYQVMIPAPPGLGWTALNLPQDVPLLEARRTYRWTVALVCDPTDRPSNDAVVRGNLIYQPKSTSALDEMGRIRSDYWLDAMSKMSENSRTTWVKFHNVSVQSKCEVTPAISDESWNALLLQSRVLNQSGGAVKFRLIDL